MRTELVWRGGRIRSALLIGVPPGAILGLIQFAQSGSAAGATFQGMLFAVFFGAGMALFMWRSWQKAGELLPADRVAVARVVRRGDVVDDARLAPAVLDYAAVVRRGQDRERRYAWVLWMCAGLALVLAVASSFRGSTRSAVGWWGLVIFWAFFLQWLPRKRAQIVANASRAETAARRIIQPPPPPPS